MTGRIGIAHCFMPAVIAMATGGASRAADWSGTLAAGANASYLTNPLMQPGSHFADQAALLTVDGNTTMKTERGQLSVTPRVSITRYHRDKALDIDTGSIDFASLEKLNRGQWTFGIHGLTDSTVTSELGLTGITNVNLRHNLGSVSTGLQYFSTERLAWQLQGSWALTRYNDAPRFGLTDYDYGSVQFGPTWSFSERLQGSLTLETDRLSPQGGTRQKQYSASLQLKRILGERYAWRASVGASRLVESGSAGSGTSSILELGASRQGERIQWDASVKRSVAPIGLGLLARQDQAALGIVARITERSTLNLAASAIRTEPVMFLRFLAYSGASWGQVSAEWRYDFSPHWTVSAAYVQARARSGTLQDWANGNQARLGILWQRGRP